MYGVYDRWYMYVAMLPCHTDGHPCIPRYPLHSAFPYQDSAILV